MVSRVIIYSLLISLVGLYSFKLAIVLALIVGLLDVLSYISTKKYVAQLKIDRQVFLEKHNQSISFHITDGKKNQQFYDVYRHLIDSLVDEKVLTTSINKGWKPWPLFMPVKDSVAQPFFLYINDGKFHFRSIKHLVQLHLNNELGSDEIQQIIKKSVEELKALQSHLLP